MRMNKLFNKNRKIYVFILSCLLFISCSNHTENDNSTVEEPAKLGCPTDGANLFIRCKDGKSKIFELGYGEEIQVIKNGVLSVQDAREFCGVNLGEINFRFKKCHFKTKGKTQRVHIEQDWKSESSSHGCYNSIEADYKDYENLWVSAISLEKERPKDPER